MANPSTPFGFAYQGLLDGSSPNFGFVTVQINPTNANHIYGGDVAGVISGGYFDVAAVVPGGAPIGGIFLPYFEWQSVAAGMTVRKRAWLGATGDIAAGGTLTAKLVMNPQALFRVRASGTSAAAIPATSVGLNGNFAVGAGPGNNLISTFSLGDLTLGAGPSLPFTIYSIDQPPVSDPTATYNTLVVRLNNQVVL